VAHSFTIPAEDEDAALAYVVANTTLTGDLDALTATFPESIPAVVVDEDYKINSRMTLADPLPEGSTVTIQITVNGAGPMDYVTDALIPASPFWVTDLFDPAAVAADFDAGYGGRIELYNITINSGGGNPEAIDTTLTVESIISKDDFGTEVVLAVLDGIPVHVDAATYELTMSVSPSEGGSTDPIVGSHTYLAGTVVDITATPAEGYEFDEWVGAVADNEDPTTTVTMNGNRTVVAHFAEITPGILGDVNDDDLINSTDALIVLSCAAGMDTSGFCPMNCGDVNDDDLINSTDALIILSYAADMDVPYPVGEAGCPSSVTPCAGCTTP
jgi:hypothetical protein